MLDYKKDIKKTDLVMHDETVKKYDKLYFSSNENLHYIFKDMDFTGKNVLTVLASGDQAFKFYDHNAKHVDLFDINKLTLYYYYLRIWHIEVYNKDISINSIPKIHDIEKLLKQVKVRTEQEKRVFDYWKIFIKKYYKNEYALHKMEEEYPFRKHNIRDLSNLQKRIKTRNFKFYNIDLTYENLSIKKKYDVIYVSNIIDWLSYDEERYKRFARNLYDLLEDDGLVMCADLDQDGPSRLEREIMDQKFKYIELPSCSILLHPPGYCYQKKGIK